MKLNGISLIAGAAVLLGSMAGLFSVSADANQSGYTKDDVKYLQDFLLKRETSDLSQKDYDLNDDGVWNVFDLILMKRIVLEDEPDTSRTLVAYYSVSGTTERIADFVAESMNADVFVITPVDEYTTADLNWTDQTSRVVTEHNDPNRHTELISTEVPDWESYDTVFIGYPIWWQEASWVVNDFVTENDFTGKNVIPFCTSTSSPLGESGTKLAEMAGTGNWLDGMRFTSRSTQEDVRNWTAGLNLTKPENENHLLVAYFTPAENGELDAISSATLTSYHDEDMGAAEVLANMIADNSDAELFSIQTAVDYPLEYNDLADYAKAEQDNDVLPELTTHIDNLDQYDTIIVVFPVWWYTMPQAIYSFFNEYDFSGKTIIPATTHAGSRLSGSPATIAGLEPDATVISEGFTVSASSVVNAEEDVIAWIENMELR